MKGMETMTVKKHTNGYRLDIQLRHRPKVRKVLKDVNEAQAKLIHDSVVAQLRNNIPKEELDFTGHTMSTTPSFSPRFTLGQAFELALKTKWKNNQSLQSYYEPVGRTTVDWFGRRIALAEVRARDISNFVDTCIRKGNSPSTINHRLAILGKLWRFAVFHWEVPGVQKIDWSEYRQRNPRKGRSREITTEEQHKMVSILSSFENKGAEQLADAIELAVWTGLRQGELLALEIADFQREFRRLYVRRSYGSKTTKTGRTRYVPVRGPALDMVERLVASARAERRTRLFKHLDRFRITALWRKLRKSMHLENDDEFVFHALRHTSASRLTRMGASTRHVQEWLGHQDIKTTQRYTHLATDDLDYLAELMVSDSD